MMSIFETGFMSAIMNRMPARTKRSIFLTSLYMECCERPNLSELNNSLSLVKDIAALDLPAFLHSWLWKAGMDAVGLLKTEVGSRRQDNNHELVVRKAPKWMIYASQQEMSRDIDRLLTLVRESQLHRS
jgi:hypothetical protein